MFRESSVVAAASIAIAPRADFSPLSKHPSITYHPHFRTRDVDCRFYGDGAWISRSDINTFLLPPVLLVVNSLWSWRGFPLFSNNS